MAAQTVTIEGVSNRSLKKEMLSHSLAEKYKDTKKRSQLIERKRLDVDLKTFGKILESNGYYDYQISYKKDKQENIIFLVKLGDIFHVKNIKVHYSSKNLDLKKISDQNRIKPNMIADADKVYKIFETYIRDLSEHGFPYAKIQNHHATVNKSTKTISIDLNINNGPKVVFGKTLIDSTADVSEKYIRHRIPWKKGEIFSQSKVNELRTKLTQSNLFSSVRIEVKESNVVNGVQNIVLILKKGKQKTLSTGLKYSTSEKLSTNLSWTNRNFTGNADKLKSTLELGQLSNLAELEYTLSDFIIPHQKSINAVSFQTEKTKTYRSKLVNVSSLLSLPLSEKLTFNYGASVTGEKITKDSRTKNLKYIAFPLSLSLDHRNNILNPTSGFQLIPSITPKIGRIGSNSYIFESGVFGTYYHAFDQEDKYVLGTWGRINSILSGKLLSIPASQRIYMGGSGSIRGYAYQFAGPLDAAGKPIGGKSAFQFGIEPRIKMTDEWGFAVFYDVGMIGNKSFITPKEDFFHSFGFGPRYYTSFGPIRADIAFPLKKRKNARGKTVDDPFQFYVSIGQSF